MSLDDFLTDSVKEEAFYPPNFGFWIRTVVEAMAFLGPETDADLEGMSKLLLDFHSGADIDLKIINRIRHEIYALRGPAFCYDTTPLGLKYRCLNAIADSGQKSLSHTDALEYSFQVAFWFINHNNNLDQELIALIQESASKYGVSLFEKGADCRTDDVRAHPPGGHSHSNAEPSFSGIITVHPNPEAASRRSTHYTRGWQSRMSGHSKWSSIKHQKGKADADRGKMFTKIAREIIVAAKTGGPNPDSNMTLRAAITRARAVSMPQDNIKRAIQRGAGGDDSANYEDLTYEGYGSGGVAVLVNCLTDNKQRTVAEVRSAFNKTGGRLGESGSVAYLFDPKGVIVVDGGGASEDAVTEAAIEGGAEDVRPTDDGGFEIITALQDLPAVQKALDDAKIAYASAEATMIPQTTVPIVGKEAGQVLRLLDMLEDNDDVQNVYANFDISDAELEAAEGGR